MEEIEDSDRSRDQRVNWEKVFPFLQWRHLITKRTTRADLIAGITGAIHSVTISAKSFNRNAESKRISESDATLLVRFPLSSKRDESFGFSISETQIKRPLHLIIERLYQSPKRSVNDSDFIMTESMP